MPEVTQQERHRARSRLRAFWELGAGTTGRVVAAPRRMSPGGGSEAAGSLSFPTSVGYRMRSPLASTGRKIA